MPGKGNARELIKGKGGGGGGGEGTYLTWNYFAVYLKISKPQN